MENRTRHVRGNGDKGEQEHAKSSSQSPICIVKSGYASGGREQKDATSKYVQLCPRIPTEHR